MKQNFESLAKHTLLIHNWSEILSKINKRSKTSVNTQFKLEESRV